jgi:predicted nucleotidyltransferase
MVTLDSTNIDRIKQLARSYGSTRLILFGSALDNPSEAQDIDLACDGIKGWKLYEFAAKLEDELRIPFDVIPLSPSNRFTKYIEEKGKIIL